MVKVIETTEEKLMRFVFTLAKNGEGYVEPNPLAGAIIVKNGQILSVGYHRYFGGPHAEIEAINKVEKQSLTNSILYINLEPCCHTDKKTPPCLKTILEIKFNCIYISNPDPNPQVSGKSIDILQNKGHKVKVGILDKEGKWLNRAFFKSITSHIPYIVLKMAITQNGEIGLRNKKILISSQEAIDYSKEERDKFNGILIGYNTLKIDNPLLLPSVKKSGIPKIFYRIILSTKPLVSLPNKKIFTTISEKYPVILITPESRKKEFKNIHPHSLILLNYEEPLSLLKILYKKFNIGKLLVEGGAKTFRYFFDSELFDEIYLYKSKKIVNNKNSIKLFDTDFEEKFSHLHIYEEKEFSNT
ncbi:MAG: bifunctional diaminohydroxyphosphoribosylaminopyrimidine deaminase/5-amino-6-(5-phosphoribosylamino)uracil reductase RibD, partial [Planctomycetota bacterium]